MMVVAIPLVTMLVVLIAMTLLMVTTAGLDDHGNSNGDANCDGDLTIVAIMMRMMAMTMTMIQQLTNTTVVTDEGELPHDKICRTRDYSM